MVMPSKNLGYPNARKISESSITDGEKFKVNINTELNSMGQIPATSGN